MIRNDQEYKSAVQQLQDEEARIAAHKRALNAEGLPDDQIKRLTDPMQSFSLQLAEEVASYERLRRKELQEIQNLRGIGHALICVRIARGMSQRELAEKLQVHETQVSRDERNEYHGVTLERAAKILEALGVEIRIGMSLLDQPAAA